MGMRRAHFFRDRARDLNLHEFAFADPGAPFARLAPVLPVANEFRPEGKCRALQRLGFVDRTSAVLQKLALRMSRNTQPTKVLCPVNVAALERWRGHFEKCGETADVTLSQIYEALLFAAFRTAGLASEAHPLG